MIKHNYSGLSLLELREKYGVGNEGFYDNNWWLTKDFAKEKPEAGEYEIDLDEKTKNLSFIEQKKKLKKGFTVAHPAIIAEAAFTHGLLKDWYVRTSATISFGRVSCVGHFDGRGLIVDYWLGSRSDIVGVGASRKLGNSKTGNLKTLTLRLEKVEAILAKHNLVNLV